MIDTNIFISSLMKASSPPGKIYDSWRKKRFTLVTSQEQIAELKRVSRYARIASRVLPNIIGETVNLMAQSRFEGPISHIHTCNDPDDSYLLDLTEAANADYLVTGDHRSGLLQRQRVGRASILTASAFLERLTR